MDDVRAWTVNGTLGIGAASPNEGAIIGGFYPAATYTTDVASYIAITLAAHDGNSNIMNYIAREHWIATFGNGIEAFNLYRRTGVPSGMQPVINATPSLNFGPK